MEVLSANSARQDSQSFGNTHGEFEDKFGIAAWAVSWATNMWTTSVIGYKAWCATFDLAWSSEAQVLTVAGNIFKASSSPHTKGSSLCNKANPDGKSPYAYR